MTNPNFDKPIGEWVNEKVEVATLEPVFDKKGELSGLKQGTRIVNQRTIYTDTKERMIDCGNKKHDYHIPDRHNHVAVCRNCTKRRIIRAVYEMVRDGKVLNRDTKEQID